MATPAQVIEQAGLAKQEEARQRHRELEDEQRKITLKTLQDDAETPQDKVAAIQAVYHKDPGVLKQHVENMTRKLTGKPTQPIVSPEQAQQARLAPIVARGKTPERQQEEAAQRQGELANTQNLDFNQKEAQQKQQETFALIDKYITDPAQNKLAKEEYVKRQAGIQGPRTLKEYSSPDGQQRNWFTPGEEPPGWNATQGATKPTRPLLTTVNGHRVLVDPMTRKITKDLGLASEVRTTTRDTAIADADGKVHIVPLTSVSVPGQGNIDVEVDPGDEGSAAPPTKGPAPKKAPSAGPSTGARTHSGATDRTLPFTKGTPAMTKARGEYDEAVKLSSMADQVAARPNDAINQKRLAVALERVSAGRFTTQALDYIIKAGWGNTLEQWANNPSTGALPADVMRQLVDGAHQNQTAALKALQAASTPISDLAPKADSKGGGKEIQYKIVNGELVPQ